MTSYSASNLNRDDLGRPKTVKMGGVERLRISSQSLKRNWRVSDTFYEALAGKIGVRTKNLGVETFKLLKEKGVKEANAKKWAEEIASVFGKKSKKNPLVIDQLVHVSPMEHQEVINLTSKIAEENRAPKSEELTFLRKEDMAVDIALFGRMLASKTEHSVEAACQVAHAISVHGVAVEDDFFTAVDDLNDGSEHSGSSHLGEQNFGAALYYNYICIDKELLVNNLNGDVELANRAIQSLIKAASMISPSGKQNSFASRAYADYMMIEKGDYQPRSLSVSFLKPVRGEDYAMLAREYLRKQRNNFNEVYGIGSDEMPFVEMDAIAGEGSLKNLLEFAIN